MNLQRCQQSPITQLQALEIASQTFREQGDEGNILIWFTQYNYTGGDYEAHPERYTGYQWPLSTARQNPELLMLQLAYFHTNSIIYHIDGSAVTVCDNCGVATEGSRGQTKTK